MKTFYNILNDRRFQNLVVQTLLILLVFLGVSWILGNTVTNLNNQGKSLGFGFLNETAGFQISRTLGTAVFDYKVGSSTYLDVFFIGIINTAIVAIIGIFLTTILGFTIGIMRLSTNLVLNGFANIYIELLRNIPLLLQMFFWYFAVLRSLPSRRERIEVLPDVMGINITGLYCPLPIPLPGFELVILAFFVAIFVVWYLVRWSRNRHAISGKAFPVFWISCIILVIFPLIIYFFSGSPLLLEYPIFKEMGPMLRRGYQPDSGMILVPEMVSVLLALVLYTSAFIAETVRSGILAISKGQTEASYALGLKPSQNLRFVVIPQALRVIIPPLTSQYLNLTKNSSLAVFIAYPELVSVFAGTALNQVGKEIEMIFMTMSVYLTFSLATAAFMNWFNARVKLVER